MLRSSKVVGLQLPRSCSTSLLPHRCRKQVRSWPRRKRKRRNIQCRSKKKKSIPVLVLVASSSPPTWSLALGIDGSIVEGDSRFLFASPNRHGNTVLMHSSSPPEAWETVGRQHKVDKPANFELPNYAVDRFIHARERLKRHKGLPTLCIVRCSASLESGLYFPCQNLAVSLRHASYSRPPPASLHCLHLPPTNYAESLCPIKRTACCASNINGQWLILGESTTPAP